MKSKCALVIVALVLAASLGHAQAPAKSSPEHPTNEQYQVRIQQLEQALDEAQLTVQSLQRTGVDQAKQIVAMNKQLVPACVAAIESANKTKQVDPKTLVVTDRPSEKK